jgi:hypothetical protein
MRPRRGRVLRLLRSPHRRPLVKLPERVDALVSCGRAQAFAPSGRRFREWAAIPTERSRTWRALLDEALAFVDGKT